MSRHLVHWYTPDREDGPGRFVAAGQPYCCMGGPLDGREMGVVDPAFRLWYASLPGGRWALATTEGDSPPEVIELGRLAGHYVPDPDNRVMKWEPDTR